MLAHAFAWSKTMKNIKKSLNVFIVFRPCKCIRKHAFTGQNTPTNTVLCLIKVNGTQLNLSSTLLVVASQTYAAFTQFKIKFKFYRERIWKVFEVHQEFQGLSEHLKFKLVTDKTAGAVALLLTRIDALPTGVSQCQVKALKKH